MPALDMQQYSANGSASRWILSLFATSFSLWIGGTVFFSAAVLPLLFLNLAPADAGRIAALLFPTYFRAGLALGLVATASAWVLAKGRGRKGVVVVVLLAAMTAAEGWSALVIHPEMARLRGSAPEAERFQDLHRLSVRLNGVVLGGGLLILLAAGRLLAFRDERP